MNFPRELEHWLIPLALIIGSTVLGVMVNRLVTKKLQPILTQEAESWHHVLIQSLHGMSIAWGIILGIYLASYTVPIGTEVFRSLEKVLLIITLLSATVVTARIIVSVTNWYTRKAQSVFPATSILINIVEISTYIVGVLIILQSIGISITPILTALGVGGIAVALALQDTLSNLFSGIHILLSKQISTGDYIRLTTGEEGYISDITWRNTTIHSLSEDLIVVPNTKIASAILRNYSQPSRAVNLTIPISVAYHSDLEKVEQVTIETARQVLQQTPGAVTSFEPVVRFFAFAESSVQFNLTVQAEEYGQKFRLRHELIKALLVRYSQEKIEIPFPMRQVLLESSPS